jgi:hypothetical protein
MWNLAREYSREHLEQATDDFAAKAKYTAGASTIEGFVRRAPRARHRGTKVERKEAANAALAAFTERRSEVELEIAAWERQHNDGESAGWIRYSINVSDQMFDQLHQAWRESGRGRSDAPRRPAPASPFEHSWLGWTEAHRQDDEKEQ